MKNRKLQLLLLALMVPVISLFAQQSDDSFKPGGKPEVRVFSNFHTAVTDGDFSNKFEIKRAYLGYSYNFSKTLSGRVTFDIGNVGAGSKNPYVGMLKYAYLQYQKKGLTASFGMVGTNSFDVQEKLWGYRYIYKSLMDEHSFGPSADLGISAKYDFSKKISADFMVVNGEGFRLAESDSAIKVGAGLTWTPTERLTFRGYYDNLAKSSLSQQTMSFAAGYAAKKFNVGGEYSYQKNNKLIEGNDFWGYSFFGTVNLKKSFKLFARFDQIDSKNDEASNQQWNIANDGQLYLAGFEFSPVKGVKIAPNFQGWNPSDKSDNFVSKFYINVEFRL